MATIKELNVEINDYLFPNIDKYNFEGETAYQINGLWLDNIRENQFFNDTLFLIQSIESTILNSKKPISLIKGTQQKFNERLIELKSYRKSSIDKYLAEFHRISIIDEINDKIIEQYQKEVPKKINELDLVEVAPSHRFFKLFSFINMIKTFEIHEKESFDNIKLLFHIENYIQNIEMVNGLLNEIIFDNEKFKIFRFDDYFKSFYNEHFNKVQVDLQLKDLASFFHFVYISGFFVLHPDKRKNKIMLMKFFTNNFMYTDSHGNPNHFKNFTKEITDIATENNPTKDIFTEDLIKKLYNFKSIDLFLYYRT